MKEKIEITFNEKEKKLYEKFLKDIEDCKISQSDYGKIMIVFGRIFLCEGEDNLTINSKTISRNILNLKRVFWLFGKNLEAPEYSFLLHKLKNMGVDN